MPGDDGSNVVHLAFSNPNLVEDTFTLLGCGNCRNKTFTIAFDKAGEFPMIKCAACTQSIGRMGWI